jgi:hypothetical protein
MFGYNHGRFTSPDPLLSSGRVENLQTWNRYAYCLNNPLNTVDPTGMMTDFVNELRWFNKSGEKAVFDGKSKICGKNMMKNLSVML